MAVTEATVKRLLAEIVGKKLVAGRIAGVERLRALIAAEDPWSSVVRSAADGLLALVADPDEPFDVRVRCIDVLENQVGRDVFRGWSRDWPSVWTDRFLLILGDRGQPEGARILAARALEARVIEDPSFQSRLTAVLARELSHEASGARVRLACLEALVETHRANPDWLRDLRERTHLAHVALPSWERWRTLSDSDKTLAAALADPAELERAVSAVGAGLEMEALEAVELHARYDASSARSLAGPVRALVAISRVVERGTSPEVVGRIAERRHLELLRAAVAYDRAKGVLGLSWVEVEVFEAVMSSAALAFALATEATFDEHLGLWIELFRDGGRGLARRLLDVVHSRTSLDSLLPPAWIALHVLGDSARDELAEASRRGLELIARADLQTVSGARVDVLVAMVASDHVQELQESGILAAVDVPTDEQYSELHPDEASTLPRRVRLARMVEVLERGTDHERIGTALALLPDVIRWIPSELARFEPLVRKHLGNGRPVQRQKRALVPPSDPNAIGRRAFDTYLACLAEIRRDRRPTSVIEQLGAHLAELARAAFVNGHSARAVAHAVSEILAEEQTRAARAFWISVVRDRKVSVARRVDAWAALDELSSQRKSTELAGVVEDILTRGDEPELCVLALDHLKRHWPGRFEVLDRGGRIRLDVPPVEHLFGHAHEDHEGPNDLRLLRERRDAIASALAPEHVIDLIERGEPLANALGAVYLVKGVVDGNPDLVARAREALAPRVGDMRSYETSIDGQREVFSMSRAAFTAYLAVLDAKPAAPPEVAVDALLRTLDQLHRFLEDTNLPELGHAREIGRCFAAAASEPVRGRALVALEEQMERLFQSPTRNVEALEGILDVYRETLVLAGGTTAVERVRDRLTSLFADRRARAGARYAAFRLLFGSDGVHRAPLLDAALRIFLDETEDGALRTLIGSVITIWKPEAFEGIVDMNTQPWTVFSGEHAELPANSLPVNMPLSWLVTALRMARHDEPHARVVGELVVRMQPTRSWGWPRIRASWLELIGTHADQVREGLRSALERPEPKHVIGRHAHAARLLALFGNEQDERLLASVAGRMWIDDVPPLNVFWRPAGKAPAFGKYSFLELYLELGFGTDGRYRTLAEAYALAAERAESAGEGGTASRFAYEAFLLAPDNPRVLTLLERLNA